MPERKLQSMEEFLERFPEVTAVILDGTERYRAVTDVYQNRVPDFDDRLMLNAVGLWNFYLEVA